VRVRVRVRPATHYLPNRSVARAQGNKKGRAFMAGPATASLVARSYGPLISWPTRSIMRIGTQ
jgi:hypothetical protein